MSGVFKGHVVVCLTVQICLVIWTCGEGRNETHKVAYLTIVPYVYVQIDGYMVSCPIQWSGNEASADFLMATDMVRGQGLYIDY